ncbi:helix-turn-helix domain-containing protein [Croceicoccus marinus]|uniref:HTH crp-type domain-containing protein n=1 Tax=Croceicoccus marinus TaxID=450378 RepID=A0A1Z1FEX5_9SPHN|nr:helix-turn-helix domain-containing protein [Croceicoccus marinus]ARU17227.1 hypothetical protein A9D14_03695 [Croceicoccus marinus]
MQTLRSAPPAICEQPIDRFVADVLPSEVSEVARLRLRELAQPVSAIGGEAVFSPCTRSRIVHIAHGSVRLVAHASEQRDQVLSFHFAGDLVLVPARAAHGYTLYALGACEMVAFAADPLFELARSDAALGHELLTRTLRALARSREKTIALGRKTAQERVASFLVGMAERIGVPDDEGCLLDLPMTRRDIADSLGLTIETISRQLGELRDAGLLATSGRSRIRLLDLPGLAARAGHLPAGHLSAGHLSAGALTKSSI